MDFDRRTSGSRRGEWWDEQKRIDAYVNTQLVKLGFDPDHSVTGKPLTPRQKEFRHLILYNDDQWPSHKWRPDSEAPPIDLDLLTKAAENARLRISAKKEARGNHAREDAIVQQIEAGPLAFSRAESEVLLLNTNRYRGWAVAYGDLIADLIEL